MKSKFEDPKFNRYAEKVLVRATENNGIVGLLKLFPPLITATLVSDTTSICFKEGKDVEYALNMIVYVISKSAQETLKGHVPKLFTMKEGLESQKCPDLFKKMGES